MVLAPDLVASWLVCFPQGNAAVVAQPMRWHVLLCADGSPSAKPAGARRSLANLLSRQAHPVDGAGPSTEANPSGSPAPQADAPRVRSNGASSRSRHDSSDLQLASPVSSVAEDRLTVLPPIDILPGSLDIDSPQLSAGGTASAAPSRESNTAAQRRLPGPATRTAYARQRAHEGASNSARVAASEADSPASDRSQNGEAHQREGRQTADATGGRLRGDDRLEALAAVLAAVEAGSHDGAMRTLPRLERVLPNTMGVKLYHAVLSTIPMPGQRRGLSMKSAYRLRDNPATKPCEQPAWLPTGGPIEIDTALLYSPRSSVGVSSTLPSPAGMAPPRSSWRSQGALKPPEPDGQCHACCLTAHSCRCHHHGLGAEMNLSTWALGATACCHLRGFLALVENGIRAPCRRPAVASIGVKLGRRARRQTQRLPAQRLPQQ